MKKEPIHIKYVEIKDEGEIEIYEAPIFSSKESYLVSHQITHTGDRLFQCKHCDKSFFT